MLDIDSNSYFKYNKIRLTKFLPLKIFNIHKSCINCFIIFASFSVYSGKYKVILYNMLTVQRKLLQ